MNAPDKVSPVQVVVESYKNLSLRPNRNLTLFLLLAGCHYLAEYIPPDPFSWLFMGLPLMFLKTPAEVLVFHNFLSGADGGARFFPDGMFRKCVVFFLWSCLLAVLLEPTFILIFTGISLSPLAGSLEQSVLPWAVSQIVTPLALLLGALPMTVGVWLLVRRALVFPGVVAGAVRPFMEAGRMVKGSFWRFSFSFVLLVLPFVAVLLVLGNLDTSGNTFGVSWFCEAAADIVCFSGLCVWYKRLSLRRDELQPTSAIASESSSYIGPYADLSSK